MPNLCSFVCDRHTEMGLVIDTKQWMIDDHLGGFSLFQGGQNIQHIGSNAFSPHFLLFLMMKMMMTHL